MAPFDMRLSLEDILYWKLRLVDGFKSRHLKTQHGSTHYLIKEGREDLPPVVFVHGTGANAYHFDPILCAINRAGYTVIAPDLFSHGRSSDAPPKVSARDYFYIFAEYLDSLLDRPFILVGNSLGGGISFRYAIERPEKVSRLVLISPVGGFTDHYDLDHFKKNVIRFDSRESIREFLDRLYHKSPWYVPLFAPLFEKALKRQGLLDLLQDVTFEYFHETRTMAPLKVPTLFIWGKSEKVFPRHHLEWFKTNLPKHVVFEEPDNVGHCPQLEAPQWLVNTILDFSHRNNARHL